MFLSVGAGGAVLLAVDSEKIWWSSLALCWPLFALCGVWYAYLVIDYLRKHNPPKPREP